MKHTRTLHTSPPKGSSPGADWALFYEHYEQPLKDWLVFKGFELVWLATWKIKPLSWLVDNVIDVILERVHRHKCNGDCGEMTWTASGETEPHCIRLPASAWLDCMLYDLDKKNNTNLSKSA